MGIKISIDLMKIDKKRIKEKNGAKYYDMNLIETPNGKYGDWMVVEDLPKEERDRGTKGTILGNGKNWGTQRSSSGSSDSSSSGSSSTSRDEMPW